MKFFISLRSKLYLIPVIYTVIFIIIALFINFIDNIYCITLTTNLPSFLFTTRELGVTIFSVEVGSLATMLTITFSTMMVVLTIYGNQLSPRTLQDFLEKK